MDSKDQISLSDADFENAMTEISEVVRNKSSNMAARELHMLIEFQRKFNVILPNHDPMHIRIREWTSRMYGERLKVNFDRGLCLVSIKGDLYKMRYMRVYGTACMVCSATPLSANARYKTPTGVM